MGTAYKQQYSRIIFEDHRKKSTSEKCHTAAQKSTSYDDVSGGCLHVNKTKQSFQTT